MGQYPLENVLRPYKNKSATMKTIILFLSALVAGTLAANTCYQGWLMHEMHTGDVAPRCHCYWFADEDTRVNHADATALCNAKGGWLAEIDDIDWHHVDNQWLVDRLLDIHFHRNQDKSKANLEGPHYDDQWWIGARSYTDHSEEHPSEWVWEHANTTVQWFDWAPNQPDDYHRQQCLAFIRYTVYGITYTYHWNDWDCNSQLADYICEAPCVEVP